MLGVRIWALPSMVEEDLVGLCAFFSLALFRLIFSCPFLQRVTWKKGKCRLNRRRTRSCVPTFVGVLVALSLKSSFDAGARVCLLRTTGKTNTLRVYWPWSELVYAYRHTSRPCTVFKVHNPSEHLTVSTPAGLRSSTSEMFCRKVHHFHQGSVEGRRMTDLGGGGG